MGFGIDADLIARFRDEETETWVKAAIEIGRLGDQAVPFLKSQLENETNPHTRRHAWCAAASYLEKTMADPDVSLQVHPQKRKKGSSVSLRLFVQNWLTQIILVHLKPQNLTLKELSERLKPFEDIRKRTVTELECEKGAVAKNEKMPEAPKKKELDAINKELALWNDENTHWHDIEKHWEDRAQTGQYKVPIPKESLASALVFDEWMFASFVAGLSPALLDFLNISLDLFVEATSALAKEQDRIALVKNTPRILTLLGTGTETERAQTKRLIKILLDHMPTPRSGPDHWIEYVDDLQTLMEAQDLDEEWPFRAQIMEDLAPPALKKAFDAWITDGSEESAIRLARSSEEQFCTETRWKEMNQNETLALSLFFGVLRAPARKGKARSWYKFTLGHRIQLVRENIDKWKIRNPAILVTLVRLLKILLYDQLRSINKNASPVNVCRRQIYWIQPLVAEWNLRGTVNKDLATIATRALCRCYDYCQKNGGGIMEYQELLYTVLYALPEKGVLKDMNRYAQHPRVEEHLRVLCDFVGETEERNPEKIWSVFDRYLEKIWGETKTLSAGLVKNLVSTLCRDQKARCKTFEEFGKGKGELRSESPRSILRWMFEIRERWHVEKAAGYPENASASFQRELDNEVTTAAKNILQRIDSVLGALAFYERAIRDAEDHPEKITQAIRDNLAKIRELQTICRKTLPFVERQVVSDELEQRYRELRDRLNNIIQVVEGEIEEKASEFIKEGEKHPDQNLIVNWMLRRHMLKELASDRNRPLKILLSWWAVLIWILSPFVLAAVFYSVIAEQLGWDSSWAWGWPFIAINFLNVGLLCWYYRAPGRFPGGLSRASLLMPQMVGTLFLGIMQSFAADATWTMAFEAHPVVRVAQIAVFLLASYFFVRYVMLRSQHPLGKNNPVQEKKLLRNRAVRILSLGIWQAFAIVMLFSLLQGAVMGGVNRANLHESLDDLPHLSLTLALVLPNIIELGSKESFIRFFIFPWAVLTWTVQLFFFGAIFERIMNRRTE